MLAPNTRISALAVVALAAWTLTGCGPSSTRVVENGPLEKAIAFYIDGDLPRAEALLAEIIREPQADEVYKTAYLYLGRVYLAEGDYEKAADALSAGRALGGDVRFDEYFEAAQRQLVISPQRVIQLPDITRGQLAGLIDRLLGASLVSSVEAPTAEEPTRTGRGGQGDGLCNREPTAVVSRAGVMTELPDGGFHPDEKVTRSALYGIIWRLIGALGAPPGVMEEAFPGGYRGSLGPRDASVGKKVGDEFVTGAEAVQAVRVVADALDEESNQ